MKFTAATSFTLLLPLALAGSFGSANVNHDAVKVRRYQPDVAADKPTNTSAALGYRPKAGQVGTGTPSFSGNLVPEYSPAVVPQNTTGSKTGMEHSDTGVDSMDSKNLVIGERRYDRDGHRRVEFKIEYGETWIQQTWEVRDGVLKQVPEETRSSSNDTSTESYSGSDDMTLDPPVPPGGNTTTFRSNKLDPEDPPGSDATLGEPTTRLGSTLNNNDTVVVDYPKFPANDTSNADTTKPTVGDKTDGESITELSSGGEPKDSSGSDDPEFPANVGADTTASDMTRNGGNQTDTLVGGPISDSDGTARTGLTPAPSEAGGAESDGARPGSMGRKLRSRRNARQGEMEKWI
ncbi:MAG: hypothetical protein Q9171_006369 [Xanthocarpia ochracea]